MSSNRILVFAGAGASKAIDAEKYPTTVEFFDRLPDPIRSHPLFKAVLDFVSETRRAKVVDIEAWLWEAARARRLFREMTGGAELGGWLLQGNRVNGLVRVTGDNGPALNSAHSAAQQLENLEDQINRLVYEHYSEEPDEGSLSRTWIPLLTDLTQRGRVDVFTTNYDLILEEAIVKGGINIETARTSGNFPGLREDPWKSGGASSEMRGLLTKLHGSVDWTRKKDRIFVGTPTFKGNHNAHAIIYPGFKSVPIDPPFAAFHEYFGKVVRDATCAVFVGFAFRDDHINQTLRDGLGRNVQVITINPVSVKLPFHDGQPVVEIGQGFGPAAVTEALRTVRRGVIKALDHSAVELATA